jgi:hypothetical protein
MACSLALTEREEKIPMTETAKKATTKKKPLATGAKKAAPKATATKTKAARSKVTMMVSQEQIAALAHRYWTERGQQHGHHEEDWLRAEHELLGKAS